MGTRGLDLGTARTGDLDGGRCAELADAAADWLIGRRPGGDPAAAALLAAICPDLDVAAVYWQKLLAGHVDGR